MPPTIAVQYTTDYGQTSIGCSSVEDAQKQARKVLSDWMRQRKHFRHDRTRSICVRVIEDDGGWPGGRVIVRYHLSRDEDWV